MKKLTIEEVKIALAHMEAIQKEHPKAQVRLDMDTGCVEVTYPILDLSPKVGGNIGGMKHPSDVGGYVSDALKKKLNLPVYQGDKIDLCKL